MTPLDTWIATVCETLGIAADELDRDLVLDLARAAAHGVDRPAAPLTTFLLGLAAGRSGADAESVRALAAKLAALAEGHGRGQGE